MRSEGPASSPFDPYIVAALQLIDTQADIPVNDLARRLSLGLNWLPGFSDVIVAFLRVNRLITINEWEPGTLRITAHGQTWLATAPAAVDIQQ